MHPQLQLTGDKHGRPPGRYQPGRRGNPNLGCVEPSPPRQPTVPSPDQKSFHTSTTPTGDQNGGPSGRHRPGQCGNPNLGFVRPAPPGQDKVPSPEIRNSSINLQFQQTGDENGRPPGRYRPARCGNSNLEFIKPGSAGRIIFHLRTTVSSIFLQI